MYIYMCVYVYIHIYVKWMSAGLMPACHKNGREPVLCQLVIKMDEYRSYAGLSLKMNAVLSHTVLSKNRRSPASCHFVIKMDAVLSHTIL